MQKTVYFWFRRDLRLNDNHGLFQAAVLAKENNARIQCVFIFDKSILDRLENPKDTRVQFIHQEIASIKEQLQQAGGDLMVWYGHPLAIWEQQLHRDPGIAVVCNRDYEPSAIARDNQVEALCGINNTAFLTFKDHCIFEKSEVTKDDGKPYTVFTPYSRKWKLHLAQNPMVHYTSTDAIPFLAQVAVEQRSSIPTLASMGFESFEFDYPEKTITQILIKEYDQKRNFPSVKGTSRLGLHFRFGTISIREKLSKALTLNETFVNELIWRDFYIQILWHFPHVVSGAFKPLYNQIAWRNSEEDYGLWKEGKTGYPIVDAGMRELNTTGFMHNRVRMIVASFLTKHLLIDWRWGEAYFAEKLLDFELASNNGGWQWAAGSGVDAAPYFRVFNPTLQMEKFDKQFQYIKQWVPEFGTASYPAPMVDHAFARKRCLDTYDAALKPG